MSRINGRAELHQWLLHAAMFTLWHGIVYKSFKSKGMRTACIMLTAFFIAYGGYAQHTSKSKHKTVQTVRTPKVPTWAAAHNYDAKEHVYFPDYYTYYDPQRGGYVYWENGKWSFSPSVPPYMQDVDLGKSRIQILKGLSLDLHPEMNYPYYMKLYPAEHKYDMVPVPTETNPAAH